MREPDDLEVIDDDDEATQGSQGMKPGRVVYVERSKSPSWLVGVATTILAGGIAAAWTANARLSGLEQQVADLKEQVAHLERMLEPRYPGADYVPHAH